MEYPEIVLLVLRADCSGQTHRFETDAPAGVVGADNAPKHRATDLQWRIAECRYIERFYARHGARVTHSLAIHRRGGFELLPL